MSTALFGKDAITGSQDPVIITNNALHTNQYVWDTATLTWIKQVQSSSTGTSSDVNITNTSIPVTQNGSWTVNTVAPSYAKRYDQVDDTLAYLGAAATLINGSQLTASPGSYSVTGASALLFDDRFFVLDSGTLSITGSSATLAHLRSINASPGSYNISGVPAALAYPYWPLPSQVIKGVAYGPNGDDYLGTFVDLSIKIDVQSGALIKPLSSKTAITL